MGFINNKHEKSTAFSKRRVWKLLVGINEVNWRKRQVIRFRRFLFREY